MQFKFDYIRTYIQEKAIRSGSSLIRKFFLWIDLVISDYTNVQAFGLWFAAIVTGLISILYTKLFQYVETYLSKILSLNPGLVFILTPVAFWVAWWLVKRFSPEAGGSGIPQIMAATEMDYSENRIGFVNRLLSLRMATIKILSSVICLLGGGAIGREGPTLQISASIFHWVGGFVRKFYGFSNEQMWVIAGSAAGLASAFNTPLGGIVYAVEELGMKHFHKIRTAILTAVIISGLVSQTILGGYLFLGFPPLKPINGSVWPLILLTGFVSGAAGALFSKILLLLLKLKNQIKSNLKLATIALICGVGVAGLIFFEPSSLGSGKSLIKSILYDNEIATFKIIIGRILATALSYMSGAAGGVFAPSLAIGASLGSKIAFIFNSPNVNLLAMLGMIGFLTGLTHAPFTSFILVLEMSDRHSAIFPMMLVGLIAHGVAKSIQRKSFYEILMSRIIESSNLQLASEIKT